MRVLITGSRAWSDIDAIRKALHETTQNEPDHLRITIVHGNALGADYMAGELADQAGFRVEVHRAEWDKYGRFAGPVRNQKMVDLGADVCLAFPDAGSVGTWDCVKRAAMAGIRVEIPGRAA